ncbi:MAG: UDP-N-acetylmuramoyl-tripeptide--D-alanyl-D-alanine ligase [Planctomycetota bacterium]
MIPMTLSRIADAVGGKIIARDWSLAKQTKVLRVSTDSRDVRRGDVFVAIRGPCFDGHSFLDEAVAKGAVACLVEEGGAADVNGPVVLIDDSIAALGRLATYYRRDVLPVSVTVVGVTGSNGKTTTKTMIDHVLGVALNGKASPKSFNNHIGVPLTILSADANDEYLVVEIGTNNPGEIAALATMASPNVGVITSVGEAHLEGLGDLRSVAAEKASLLAQIRPMGLAVVNIDRPEIRPYVAQLPQVRLVTVGTTRAARLHVDKACSSLTSTTFELEGRYTVELPMPGAHHATNAAATFAVARWFGVATEEIIARLRTFVPPEGRTRRLDAAGVTIIDDAYNANPSSVLAAVEALRSAKAERRIFVLGDMLELGKERAAAHERTVAAILSSGIEVLVAVGPNTCAAVKVAASASAGVELYACDEAGDTIETLERLMQPGDAIWIKASRAMQLDTVVRALAQRAMPTAAVA